MSGQPQCNASSISELHVTHYWSIHLSRYQIRFQKKKKLVHTLMDLAGPLVRPLRQQP